MFYLYVYFAVQVSTHVESGTLQAAESTVTAVESASGAEVSVEEAPHDANVTINASAKIVFFIVLCFICLFLSVGFEGHNLVYKYVKSIKKLALFSFRHVFHKCKDTSFL